MSVKSSLLPSSKPTVMELVREAGLDVADWANFDGGQARAATNPRYCYEWAFIEPRRMAVLNLWHADLVEENGQVTTVADPLRRARRIEEEGERGPVVARALRMNRIIEDAKREGLPLRVIVLAGERRGHELPATEKSKVTGRALDPEHWRITHQDSTTGDWYLTRGGAPERFTDQFTDADGKGRPVEVRTRTGRVYVRDRSVRERALRRARGFCEWCRSPGFIAVSGEIYLETHHIDPLFEEGPDDLSNVIALCPNDHRRAHWGSDRVTLRAAMRARVRDLSG